MKGRRPASKITLMPPPPEEGGQPTIPPAPEWFGAYAADAWVQIFSELIAMGADLEKVGCVAPTNLALAMGNIRTATEQLEAGGVVGKGRQESEVKNPAITMLSQAQTQARNWAVELGLTPASRGKVPTSKPAEKKKKFAI